MNDLSPLAVVGNVNVDLIMGPVAPWPRPGTEMIVGASEVRYGGAAGNVALAWRALGREFQIAANTGRDALGNWLRNGFAPHSDVWPVSDGATMISVGLTHPDSERTFFTTKGHVADLTWSDVRGTLDWTRLSGGTLLLCGTFVTDELTADYDRLLDHARDQNIRVALDTGWPPGGWTTATRNQVLGWLGRCDCLLLNEIETRELSGSHAAEEAPSILLPLMPDDALVVVKCGAGGVVAATRDREMLKVPAPAVEVADTIGAGDIFNAAFIAIRADGRPLLECLEAGVRTATAAISTSPRRYGMDEEPPTQGASV
ncbi:carbohydrate kinase family protein [Defluviimonas aestuarii]|uniref:carbohydrate kinase family protein n=1 Tax=Albidovulum aestuarii TaxID=1130726 RepID=UPI00249BC01C|nr:carbohydrate kinase family protein [Defluviimonas aestuarii]MDI3337199.1 carbohydrate kinase family protein [Defluviimonas aestuarii]